MAKFKIVTTAGPGTGVPGADHSLEMEALAGIGAEIVEVKGGEDELAAAAVDADAIYGKGRPRITAKVIQAGKKLKVVSLASVGVDSVDVEAATALGIPGDQLPRHLHRGSGRPCHDPDPRLAGAASWCRTRWCARATGPRRGRCSTSSPA